MRKVKTLAVALSVFFCSFSYSQNLWINIKNNSTDSGNELAIKNAKVGDFKLPLSQPSGLIKNERGWEVEGLDSNGKVLSQTFIMDGSLRRFETFDPQKKTVSQVKYVAFHDSEIRAIIPFSDALAKVHVYPVNIQKTAQKGVLKESKPFEVTRQQIEKVAKNLSSSSDSKKKLHSQVVTSKDSAVSKPMTIAIMGDGYTQDEMGQWKSDADGIIKGFMSDPLINSLKDKFKFVRVDVVSNESGVSNITNYYDFYDTALGTIMGCSGIERLLCVDTSAATSAADNALGVGGYDQILVVANTYDYAGAGYTDAHIGTLTLNDQSIEIALHEFAHSAYNLADEYDDDGGNCDTANEPTAANVTLETQRKYIKWASLIKPETAIPTSDQTAGVVGLFRGAEYCPNGKYRATYDSKMRTLSTPWYAVNEARIREVMSHYGQ